MIEERVLYLAQDPSSTAAETGFISPDNNDRTANATTEACLEARLAARERVHWNVYPSWLKTPCDRKVPLEAELARIFLVVQTVRGGRSSRREVIIDELRAARSHAFTPEIRGGYSRVTTALAGSLRAAAS